MGQEMANPAISGLASPCPSGGSEGVRRRSYNWLLINAEILSFRLACIYTL